MSVSYSVPPRKHIKIINSWDKLIYNINYIGSLVLQSVWCNSKKCQQTDSHNDFGALKKHLGYQVRYIKPAHKEQLEYGGK
jgi:hypothetical protein